MAGVLRDITEHKLNVYPSLTPVRQKKRHMALNRNDWLCAEVDNLVRANILREVLYQTWVANPVLVKKADGNWWMCVDFKDINKACPKDNYLLPEINWKEAESAFQDMKKVLAELPTLTMPIASETLTMYLAASKEAVSSVLIVDRGKTQMPVYFVSKMLTESEVNYSSFKKLVYALVHTAQRLRRYFQAHPVVVLTDQPIKQVLYKPEISGRMAKWAVELGEHEINFSSRSTVKGQILADYLAELPADIEASSEYQDIPALILAPWELYTDGACSTSGVGAGADALSKLDALAFDRLGKRVLIEELQAKSIVMMPLVASVEESSSTWMTLIVAFLRDGTSPADSVDAKKVRTKAPMYALEGDVLYQKSYLGPYLRCIGPNEAEEVIREVHEGACAFIRGTCLLCQKLCC
ncbi:uncharacterized protein [Rutidosis leptorrhynchoides]|uniref:uncharacterized protein n=1 Tax=Rutidosis leptorrhynchoides TaxID=125765 RepID=UPI003A9973FF